MNKKLITFFITFIAVFSSLSANAYEDGYLAGYQDALLRKENKFENRQKERSSINSDIWELKYYVNEFQESTDNGYIMSKQKFYGTYSSSYIDDEDCTAGFQIDKDSVALTLFDNDNDNLATGTKSFPTTYKIALKCDDKIYNFVCSSCGEKIYFNKPKTMINIFQLEKPIKMSIVEYNDYSDKTFFIREFDTTGFNRFWNKIQ